MTPSSYDRDIVYFAQTNFRGKHQRFGIRRIDRCSHMYLIGKTGTGKSTLIGTLIGQDMQVGDGLALLDPHGDLIDLIRKTIPINRRGDLLDFDVPDSRCPYGFNPLGPVPPEKRPLLASGLLDVFRTRWEDSWGPRLEYILRHALLALLDQPQATLADVRRLLHSDSYRRTAATHISSAEVRAFWLEEYPRFPLTYRANAIAPIENKVGALLADAAMNRILTQPAIPLDLRRIIDEGKILLVNLAKGNIGGDACAMLGSLLTAALGVAALSRADQPEAARRDFYLYLDEFPNFTTPTLAGMLADLRKYRLSLILAHQHLDQLVPEVRSAIFGNVGTLISFRLGHPDAKKLAEEFYPVFSADDLINLPNYNVYLKLLIDGQVSKPFSAETLGLEQLR